MQKIKVSLSHIELYDKRLNARPWVFLLLNEWILLQIFIVKFKWLIRHWTSRPVNLEKPIYEKQRTLAVCKHQLKYIRKYSQQIYPNANTWLVFWVNFHNRIVRLCCIQRWCSGYSPYLLAEKRALVARYCDHVSWNQFRQQWLPFICANLMAN